MLDIIPAPTNIYDLKQRHSTDKINIGNVDHVDFEKNIGKSDI